MNAINKTAIGIAAGVAGTIFIGYCIYFDSKRRTDPDYKKKVRERKYLAFKTTWSLCKYIQLQQYILGRRRTRKNGNAGRSGIPNLNDHEAIER